MSTELRATVWFMKTNGNKISAITFKEILDVFDSQHLKQILEYVIITTFD